MSEDEAAGVPGGREGGDTPSARKCTYMELALCLAPGLDVNGIGILYKAAKPALQVSHMTHSSHAHNVRSMCVAAGVH